MLLVGTKLLALYPQPNAPDLQSGDLFLLGLFVQDVLDRDAAPGLEVPPTVRVTAASGAAAKRACRTTTVTAQGRL